MKKRKVKARRINWDVQFYTDLMNGDGFIITEPAAVSLDGSKAKSYNGARSPRYGSTYGDEDEFMERWRCQCGTFTSRLFEGEVCPYCNHKVEYREVNIKMTGWITLGSNVCVNPYYYNILAKLIGKQVISDIVIGKHKITLDGKKVKPDEEDYDAPPSSPYAGIGVDAFFENFENIMKYFASVKKQKAMQILDLINVKRAVFTSHIPVYSTMLRGQSLTEDSFYFSKIDKLINTLFSLSEHIKNCVDVERDYILSRIQMKVNGMFDENMKLLIGKDAHIRGELLGGSLNQTARNVIIPDPTLKDDEVDISYHTFRVLYKNKILHYIMKLEDCTLAKANLIWLKSYVFDQKVYDIMQYIIEDERNETRVLINRNPTLNYYSMLLMKIRQVKPDGNDYCLSVPLGILAGLNADFDGDILNIIGIMDRALVHMFSKFEPVTRMIISRDSGLLNDYFSITKGQLIDLYYFCTIGKTENDEEETYRCKMDNEIVTMTVDQMKAVHKTWVAEYSEDDGGIIAYMSDNPDCIAIQLD